MCSETLLGPHVKDPLLLTDFNKNWKVLTINFIKIILTLLNSLHTNTRTGTVKIIG
jgi:hypothetical protein